MSLTGYAVGWALIGVLLLAVLLAVGWWLSYTATRLDRLHIRAEGNLAALDAALVRRADAVWEFAEHPSLDAASRVVLLPLVGDVMDAAQGSAVLIGRFHPARLAAEDDLTLGLRVLLSQMPVPADDSVENLVRVHDNVRIALSVHQQTVSAAQALHRHPLVRLLRLAGRAALPTSVAVDADLGAPGRGVPEDRSLVE